MGPLKHTFRLKRSEFIQWAISLDKRIYQKAKSAVFNVLLELKPSS